MTYDETAFNEKIRTVNIQTWKNHLKGLKFKKKKGKNVFLMQLLQYLMLFIKFYKALT